ncbi:nucleoside 2-deoxyribosyltransferase [Candidatus Nomurabacteria bacterium]|nr:nucleoside 2-deoxyribosyltransferase [Candidatus Nomurabacteria bacterium]
MFGDDTGWLDESDIVIAEVTTPSLGVGYELGRAEAKGKRVICLFREGGDKKLSAMILGNKKFITIQYSDMTELPDIFNLYLN